MLSVLFRRECFKKQPVPTDAHTGSIRTLNVADWKFADWTRRMLQTGNSESAKPTDGRTAPFKVWNPSVQRRRAQLLEYSSLGMLITKN